MRTKTVVGGSLFVLAGAVVLVLASCGGGGGGSSSTSSDVWSSTTTPAGVTIDYPAGWVTRPSSRSDSTLFSNVEESSGHMEDILHAESFFLISRRVGVNPDRLPIAEWFAKLSVGTSEETLSNVPFSVDGHDAVRVVVSEFGGRRVYVYIFADTDVIEVTYGLFEPKFVDEYVTMLQSISLGR